MGFTAITKALNDSVLLGHCPYFVLLGVGYSSVSVERILVYTSKQEYKVPKKLWTYVDPGTTYYSIW